MGSDGASSTLSTFYESLSSQSANRSGIAALIHLCKSARVAAQGVSLTSIANHLRDLYGNNSVNWGQTVFLLTCVITMAGCGLFSSVFRRRRAPGKKTRSQRLFRRQSSTKSSSKTLTSSDDDYEDEEYDSNSNGSLRHGMNAHSTVTTEWSSQPQQQTADGESTIPSV